MLILISNKNPTPFDRVQKVLEDKPVKWAKHEPTKHGLQDIVDMEYENLCQTLKTGTYQETIEAYEHLGAAVMNALSKMTCK